jgi:hypothetical protein
LEILLRFEGLESASPLPCGYCGDLKRTVTPGAKLKIAASCFSIYAYEALKAKLKQVESVEFIFTSPTFVQGQATAKLPKEKREFFIPKLNTRKCIEQIFKALSPHTELKTL